MRTLRFGRKLKLPSTIAIKHQVRMLMFQDAAVEAGSKARAEQFAGDHPKVVPAPNDLAHSGLVKPAVIAGNREALSTSHL